MPDKQSLKQNVVVQRLRQEGMCFVILPCNMGCSLSKIRPPLKIAPFPSFSLKVIAKGHLLLESMPTQQTKIICSNVHSDEIHSVHVCVG